MPEQNDKAISPEVAAVIAAFEQKFVTREEACAIASEAVPMQLRGLAGDSLSNTMRRGSRQILQLGYVTGQSEGLGVTSVGAQWAPLDIEVEMERVAFGLLVSKGDNPGDPEKISMKGGYINGTWVEGVEWVTGFSQDNTYVWAYRKLDDSVVGLDYGTTPPASSVVGDYEYHLLYLLGYYSGGTDAYGHSVSSRTYLKYIYHIGNIVSGTKAEPAEGVTSLNSMTGALTIAAASGSLISVGGGAGTITIGTSGADVLSLKVITDIQWDSTSALLQYKSSTLVFAAGVLSSITADSGGAWQTFATAQSCD